MAPSCSATAARTCSVKREVCVNPSKPLTINSFDAYAGVMSGIMEACGLTGFMENRDSYARHRNEDDGVNAEIIERLCEQYKDNPFTSSEMFELFKNPITGALDGVLPVVGNSEQAQMTSLGHLLKREFVGRVFEIALPEDGETVARFRFMRHGAKGKAKYYLKLQASEDNLEG